jgi:2-haloacid dehalogenase
MSSAIEVRALLFDVFGTVVDWRGSVMREIESVGSDLDLEVDSAELADAWRSRYGPSMDAVLTGVEPYRNLDALHRSSLQSLLSERGIEMESTDVDRLVTAWHRLDAWPDAAEALNRLRNRYIIGTMSNGSVALLTNMAKYAGLPWDVILTPELLRTYKKNLESYRYVTSLLGLEPSQVMMVAAHIGELKAVKTIGMRTAYVPRPMEFGSWDASVLDTDVIVDLRCEDLSDLADRLEV